MSIDLVEGSFNERVAKQIRSEMAYQGLSQTQIARFMRQTQNRISRLLTGKQPLTLDDIEEFAAALGLPLSRILQLNVMSARGRRASLWAPSMAVGC